MLVLSGSQSRQVIRGSPSGPGIIIGATKPIIKNGKNSLNNFHFIVFTEPGQLRQGTAINPNIFAYNENRKAVIVNPTAGPYKDLVKSAERCTAQVIHPGLPRHRSAPGMERWLRRAEPFN